MPAEPLTVAVTVATRGRPDACARLVRALTDQDAPADWQLRIIVVDNQPEGSGLELPTDERVEVLQEPAPGIPAARNRALDAALASADIIGFLDDDVVPPADWLRTLVDGLDRHGADVVSGPVAPQFPPGTSEAITLNPLFAQPDRESGASMPTTHAQNTVARAQVFRDGLRFDPALGEAGGSDTQMFNEAARGGAEIRWVAEAVVDEPISEERASARWLMSRSFQIGGDRTRFLRSGPSALNYWIVLLTGSILEILTGVFAPIVALGSRRVALMLLGRASRGLGSYAALVKRP